jgi:hypothetical protein
MYNAAEEGLCFPSFFSAPRNKKRREESDVLRSFDSFKLVGGRQGLFGNQGSPDDTD